MYRINFFGENQNNQKSELESIYAPIILKNSNIFSTAEEIEIGKIKYLDLIKIQENNQNKQNNNIILEINYKDEIITEVILNNKNLNSLSLEKILEQFFNTVYEYKSKDSFKKFINNLTNSQNDVLQIKIRHKNIALPILEKKYIILPVKVINPTSGLMEEREIYYEINDYTAYQIGKNIIGISNIYFNMASKILEEIKKS